MDKIRQTLFNYLEELYKIYPKNSILGIFLYGSQNYNFDWEGSDIDAKAIYIPSKEEIALLKQPISKEYKFDTGHVEIKDIRLMWQMWKKQNMNFVEILFTDYFLINPMYIEVWNNILFYREKIARYDEVYAITSAYHQAYNTLKQGTTGKKIANAIRIEKYLSDYIQSKPYKDCIRLTDTQKNFFIDLKIRNDTFDENDPIVKSVKDNLYEKFLASNYLKIDIDRQQELDKSMTYIIIDALRIREELWK